jgi:hypothetical protein
MISSIESASTPTTPRKLNAHTAAVLARLRDLAPYAAIELVLPGGSLIALLLWLYRRHKKEPVFPESLDESSWQARSSVAGCYRTALDT